MKILRIIAVCTLGASTWSCASYFKRKECEKTNWYQHGFDVAMRGDRLDSDAFVNDCSKVEAEINFASMDTGFKAGMQNYCTDAVVEQKGFAGDFLKLDFCEPNKLPQLKTLHARGVRRHCHKDNSYKVGASGRKYNGICPESMVQDFMPGYKRGRRVFLREEINTKEREITALSTEIASDEVNRARLQTQIANLSRTGPVQFVDVVDPTTGRFTRQRRVEPNPDYERQRVDLQGDIKDLDQSISKKRETQAELRRAIGALRVEINGLEE